MMIRLAILLLLGFSLVACGKQATKTPAVSPLLGVSPRDLCLDAFESGPAGDRAWLLDGAGNRIALAVDDRVGPNHGLVTSVSNEVVVVVEIHEAGGGDLIEREVRIEPCPPTEPPIDHNADPESP